jgi:hypothetical protein
MRKNLMYRKFRNMWSDCGLIVVYVGVRCEYRVHEKQEGVLWGKQIVTSKASTREDCLDRCEQHATCVGFEYATESGLCAFFERGQEVTYWPNPTMTLYKVIRCKQNPGIYIRYIRMHIILYFVPHPLYLFSAPFFFLYLWCEIIDFLIVNNTCNEYEVIAFSERNKHDEMKIRNYYLVLVLIYMSISEVVKSNRKIDLSKRQKRLCDIFLKETKMKSDYTLVFWSCLILCLKAWFCFVGLNALLVIFWGDFDHYNKFVTWNVQ